jgi:hypothetical protein
MVGKTIAALVSILFLTLTLVAIPTVSAKPKGYSGTEVIYSGAPYGPDDHWAGPISGAILGTVEFWETNGGANNYVVGQTEHFFEVFLITTSCGTVSGTDKGLWSLVNYNFKAGGPVTGATGCNSGLVGYKFHEQGVTSDPFAPNMAYVVGLASWSLTR